jgi:hypothetical protein
MVVGDKHRGALLAINAVLIQARGLAYEGKSGELAAALDMVEYLPMLILEPCDRTDEFREKLAGLAERFPGFGSALKQFDGPPKPATRARPRLRIVRQAEAE